MKVTSVDLAWFCFLCQIVNTYISATTQTYKNEQWKINSNSQNECQSGNANDVTTSSSEFNPLKCRPLYRDWMYASTDSKIKNQAQIVSDTLYLLDEANKPSDPNSFIFILDDLKKVYDSLQQALKTIENILK